MDYLDKLEKKLENLIEALKVLKTENIDLKSKLNGFEEKKISTDKDKDEIQKKVLGMIEMIDNMKESE